MIDLMLNDLSIEVVEFLSLFGEILIQISYFDMFETFSNAFSFKAQATFFSSIRPEFFGYFGIDH